MTTYVAQEAARAIAHVPIKIDITQATDGAFTYYDWRISMQCGLLSGTLLGSHWHWVMKQELPQPRTRTAAIRQAKQCLFRYLKEEKTT